ncbi:hypothetical protein [Amycolatopsis granulosa]|uniref:WXG100-like domain-containing protein n=1 Tax=Amycolatopsis granulosa TaxID=185684 RepID=UPI0014219B64|nr:hypothetical protein [Amycolatopsis granulosa]NIH86209.1 hypothetical protein [Amycolatopsis granulosa]
MAIEIPDWLKPLASIVAGQEWPEGNEDLLRVLRDGWAAAAQGAADVQRAFVTLMEQTPNPPDGKVMWTGDGAKAFMDDAKKFVEGDKAHFPSLQKVCQALSDACGDAANEVEYGKLMIIATLIITAAFIAYALAMAAITFGGSSAAIPVAQAGARAAIQQIFRMLVQKLMTMGVKGVAMAVLKQIAVNMGISLALDAGIQGYQMAEGNRKDWDEGKTKDAAVGGAVDGVVSAASLGIAKGATRGVSSTAGQLLDASVRGGVRGALEGVASTVGQAAVTGDLDKLSAKDIAYGASGGVFGGASDLETGGVQGHVRSRVADMRTLGEDIPDGGPRVDGSGGGAPPALGPASPRGGDQGGSGGPGTGSPGAAGNSGGGGPAQPPRQPAPDDYVSRQSASTIDDLAARTAYAPSEPGWVQGSPAPAAPQSFGPAGSGGPVNPPAQPAGSAGAPASPAQPRAPFGGAERMGGTASGGAANSASPTPGRAPSVPEGGAPVRTPDGHGRTPSTSEGPPGRATGAPADAGTPRSHSGAPDPARAPGPNTPPTHHPGASAGSTHTAPRTDRGPVPPHGTAAPRTGSPPETRADGPSPHHGAPPPRAGHRPAQPAWTHGTPAPRPDHPPAQGRPDGPPSRPPENAAPRWGSSAPAHTPPPPHPVAPPPPAAPHTPASPHHPTSLPPSWLQPPPATPPRAPEPPHHAVAPRTAQPADLRSRPDPASHRPADPPDVPRHYFPDNSATPGPEPDTPVPGEHGEAREPDTPPDYDTMPRLEDLFPDEGVSLNEDAARDAFGAVYDRQYGDYRIEVTGVTGGAAHLTVQGAIFDVHGREVGGFRRTFSRYGEDRFVVEHSSLNLRRAVQGQGLAAMFNRDMEGYYRRNNVEFIHLKANSDVGSYTWARADYEFSHHRDVQQTIMPRLRAGIAEAKAVLAQMQAEHQRLTESQDFAGQRRAGELERRIRWHQSELRQAQDILRTLGEAEDTNHPGYPRPREIADLFRPPHLDGAQSRNVFWMGKIVLMEPGAGMRNPVEWHGRKYLG